MRPMSATHRHSLDPSLQIVIPCASRIGRSQRRSSAPSLLSSSTVGLAGWNVTRVPLAVSAMPWCAQPRFAASRSGISAKSSIHS